MLLIWFRLLVIAYANSLLRMKWPKLCSTELSWWQSNRLVWFLDEDHYTANNEGGRGGERTEKSTTKILSWNLPRVPLHRYYLYFTVQQTGVLKGYRYAQSHMINKIKSQAMWPRAQALSHDPTLDSRWTAEQRVPSRDVASASTFYCLLPGQVEASDSLCEPRYPSILRWILLLKGMFAMTE